MFSILISPLTVLSFKLPLIFLISIFPDILSIIKLLLVGIIIFAFSIKFPSPNLIPKTFICTPLFLDLIINLSLFSSISNPSLPFSKMISFISSLPSISKSSETNSISIFLKDFLNFSSYFFSLISSISFKSFSFTSSVIFPSEKSFSIFLIISSFIFNLLHFFYCFLTSYFTFFYFF